ncbi:hypothetical protein [Marinobacterium mangrovicola]|uniref:Uncharacterized protein n=1 Tax=Marinobacterium mangrovicola TaxID=1476959 RepID=A0A4R1GMQ7_9GAMM|nr:hypothetical protein [Marinobacterium mangrovicola]TCK08531.1 hypothetical protein CLV83_0616 [Marinobacterium mangrovicola]
MKPFSLKPRDPFSFSLFALPVIHRFAGITLLLAVLWIAVGWAVSLP